MAIDQQVYGGQGRFAILRCAAKSTAYQLTPAVLLADLHAQERDADAREGAGRGCTNGEARRRRRRRSGRSRRRCRRRRRTGRHDRRQRG